MKTDAVLDRKSMPAGPEISGTVTVNLTDLDKMRTDHAKWKKLGEELLSKEKQVKVTFIERRDEMVYSGYSRRWVSDPKYIETGIEYINFEEVRNTINVEEHNKVRDEIISRDRKIDALEENVSKLMTDLQSFKKLKVESDKINEELTEQVKSLEETVANNGEEYDKLISVRDGLMENVDRLTKELELEKQKKGFWSFFSK